jgi:pimeloyl-ACP methyl ester carboxylesterase
MVCSERIKLVLFSAYVVSIVSALANPANLNYEDAYLMTQAANVTTLALLSYCKGSLFDAFLAAALGVAFAYRATGSWRGGSRWDSLLVTIGMLLILQDAFYSVIPHNVKHRFLLYLAFSCTVMPVLSALPHLLNMPSLVREDLVNAARFCGEAYAMPRNEETLLGPLWRLYDASTDTRAGVSRILTSRGKTDVYVYFAGTSSFENWKTNANILGDNVPADWGCMSPVVMSTHKGYTKAFTAVAPKMLSALEAELSTSSADGRIIFCGHSMGGALATMAALYTACKLPRYQNQIAVVTFGAPQVGDSNFVAFFNKFVPTCVRVCNPMDPVPRLLNAQLIHVKGYYPVGSFTLESSMKAHSLSTYKEAVDKPRAVSVLASFTPAVVGASAVGLYIAWQLGRVR